MRHNIFLYPNFNNTYYQIDLPFSSFLKEELKPGLLILIAGKVNESASRFQIDLFTQLQDVAFQFNPRFSEHCVVRNSKINNVWGKEEREGNLPFRHNCAFEIIILVTNSAYKVAVNGKHFTNFVHRIPFTDVKQIKIEGDVIIDKVQYRTEPLYAIRADLNAAALKPSTLHNPLMPLVHNINGKVIPGFTVYVSGRPFSAPYRFSINFQKETDIKEGVLFHFDVRFDEHCVIRNHYDNGWGEEERWIPCFPFSGGVGFDIIFCVRDEDFMVAVNGQSFINFKHRMLPLSDIKYLNIDGHLNITSVCFCGEICVI